MKPNNSSPSFPALSGAGIKTICLVAEAARRFQHPHQERRT